MASLRAYEPTAFTIRTMTTFNSEDWRNIFRGYRDTPEHQIGIEILRQHLLEDIRVDPKLLTSESTWYRHYKRSPTAYTSR